MYTARLSTGRTDCSAVQTIGDAWLEAEEIERTLACTPGAFRLIGEVLYATGMRLEELLRMRVRDVEAEGWCLVVRSEEGSSLRRLRLPFRLRDALQDHLHRLQVWHAGEMARGRGDVVLTGVDTQGHPLGGRRWCWQYVFPSAATRSDLETGRSVRPHLEAARVQAVLAEAGRAAGVSKPVHAQSLRHAFAMLYLGKGRPVEDLQKLLGHANPATTHRYIEVLQAVKGRMAQPQAWAPIDRMPASSRCPPPGQLAFDLAMAS